MSQEQEEAVVDVDLKYLEGVYLDAEIERRKGRDHKSLDSYYVILPPRSWLKELPRPRKGGVDQWRVLI